MQVARRLASNRFAKSAFAGKRNVFKSFSTAIHEKGVGDEERYFREQDEIRKAEIKAQIDKILALDLKDKPTREALESLYGYHNITELIG